MQTQARGLDYYSLVTHERSVLKLLLTLLATVFDRSAVHMLMVYTFKYSQFLINTKCSC
jgi:hypothetical protein